jgi:hypothetical protein
VQRVSKYFNCAPEEHLTIVELAIGAGFGGYG